MKDGVAAKPRSFASVACFLRTAPIVHEQRNRREPKLVDGFIYSLRNQIHLCFATMTQSRRFSACYDKTAARSLGFALLNAIRLRVRRIGNTA